MKARWLIGAAAMVLLTGCAENGAEEAPVNGMSAEEGCIVKQETPHQKVCYGMKMSEVEAVAGAGEEMEDLLLSYQYEGGLRISYRGDTAVFLTLQQDSEGYETIRGTAPGTSKNEMKSQYGEQYALDEAEPNLDYFFDLDNVTPLSKDELMSQNNPEEMERTLVVSAMFGSNGSADRLMILDRRMAVYFN